MWNEATVVHFEVNDDNLPAVEWFLLHQSNLNCTPVQVLQLSLSGMKVTMRLCWMLKCHWFTRRGTTCRDGFVLLFSLYSRRSFVLVIVLQRNIRIGFTKLVSCVTRWLYVYIVTGYYTLRKHNRCLALGLYTLDMHIIMPSVLWLLFSSCAITYNFNVTQTDLTQQEPRTS